MPIRIASRNPPLDSLTEWVFLDLETGEGLQTALADIDIVLHAATSPMKKSVQIDVQGTKKLLKACKENRIKHFLFPSIVGIEALPMAYYQAKLEAESIIKDSDVPYTILRATQFHSLIDRLFQKLNKLPISVLPTQLKCQSVDVTEVATTLLSLCHHAPQGHIKDFGGPEILTLKEMYEIWKKHQRKTSLLIPLPHLPLPLFKAMKEGKNTNPEQKSGNKTWSEWIYETYARL